MLPEAIWNKYFIFNCQLFTVNFNCFFIIIIRIWCKFHFGKVSYFLIVYTCLQVM